MTSSPFLSTETAAAARPSGVRARWARRYAIRLIVSDTLVVVAAVVAAHLLWLGDTIRQIETHATSVLPVSYPQASLALTVTWLAALALFDSRDERELGAGATEYRRVAVATGAVFGAVVVAAFFLGLDISRAWAITVFPLGIGGLLASRWTWRQWLLGKRRAGDFSNRVVLVGSTATVLATAQDLARQPAHGYHVVGAALTDGPAFGDLHGLPLVGEIDSVPDVLAHYRADTVIATSSDHLPPERIRDLAWRLDRRHQLVVAPSLTDVVGSRIHVRPAAGLPLIHVETPHYASSAKLAKRAFDIVAALGLLVILAPVLVLISLLVHRDSAGGVFYTQERIGRGGEPFRILKFRTMVPDAEAILAQLVDPAAGKSLFKLRDDPRVTRIGRILRRYSLDELPQLFNVLRGDMSLVGPRPALPTEVSEYDRRELRRLAVTPGLSGLWQVSGRSDLNWADGIRLDLYYVENWSMTQDLVILWRTVKAVLGSHGAY